jgi:xanthine dehydrogenase YagR molybdenum-binding subunit
MSIMRKVVETVAHVMPDRDRDLLADQHRYLGKPIDRLDGRAKVTGAASFSAEYQIEGMVHAALVYRRAQSRTSIPLRPNGLLGF